MRWYDAIESSIAERHAFIKEYHDLSKRLDENLAARHSLSTKEILANAQNLPLLVLVIGESTQRNYLSLYGYPLSTTPRLEALEQAGNLVLFRDFISSFPNTDRSLQRALTFSHYENPSLRGGNNKTLLIFSILHSTKPTGSAIKICFSFMVTPQRSSRAERT